ncbi:hypothetical protein, partial [Klebsiella pneumoniae]|uniref:hypothetical protein n=1 Tax=Klebsiella pneumoniae TaxID=573 RepID=UPI001C9C2F6D
CRAAAHALPGIRFMRPAVNLFTIVAETAGADGLKIAETFPEGRGSPHPCGLPRPSGNVSAILRPSAPAVSATMVNKLTAGRMNRMPGKA